MHPDPGLELSYNAKMVLPYTHILLMCIPEETSRD